jgi:hypothetical protein
MQLLAEAFVVGFILLLVSIPIMGIVRTCFEECNHYKYYVATVIIGMITHFIFEYSGANAWYCTKGWACLKEEEKETEAKK